VSAGYAAQYDGVSFRRFQNAVLRVDSVLGELYWRVQAGERVNAEDYIAPPAMLSREVSADEQNWSLSTYLTPKDVSAAFAKPLELPAPVGVAPNQPYGGGIGKVWALVTTAFFAVGIAKCASAPAAEKLRQHFTVPMNAGKAASPTDASDPWLRVNPTPTPPLPTTAPAAPAAAEAGSAAGEPSGAVMFSDKFQLEGGRNVAFELSANLSNNWVYAALDLVNDNTGSVVSLDKSIEYYAGYDSDGSWSEGSTTADDVIGPVEAGTYVLRVEGQHGGLGGVDLGIAIRQGVFRAAWFWTFYGLLMIPFAVIAVHAISFRRRRWDNSNVGARASSAGNDDSNGGSDDD
jgi:hypothetical protein